MASRDAWTRIKESTRTCNPTRTSAAILPIHRLVLFSRLISHMDVSVSVGLFPSSMTLALERKPSFSNRSTTVYAYTDTACTENQITVPVGIDNCYNSTAAGLGSFEVVCTS